jgi:hypothetical protein
MACKITQEKILTTCSDIAVGGVTGRVWLFNFDDWKLAEGAAGITVETTGEISGIDLTGAGTGAKSYRIETPQGSVITGHAYTKNANGISGFTHLITIVISDLSMLMKNSLSSLANFNKVIAIVETNAAKPATSGVGDSQSPPYICFGLNSGLEMSAADGNLSDQAAGNSITLTIQTPVNSTLELNFPTNVDMSTADIIATETAVPATP